VHVARVRIDHADHAVRRHLAGDPPGAILSPGSTSCPATSPSNPTASGLLGGQGNACHCGQHRSRIADQRTDQPGARLGVVSGARRLARVVVIVVRGQGQPSRSRDQPAHLTDRSDQLGHGVLGGDRVIQQRGINAHAGLARRNLHDGGPTGRRPLQAALNSAASASRPTSTGLETRRATPTIIPDPASDSRRLAAPPSADPS
jgi:hypothetical protein